MGSTYYTKCGRIFTKNSTALVTGYKLDLQADGRLRDYISSTDFEPCLSCLFRIEITDGWPDKNHVRWECRAGSQPPNRVNEWSGSLDDKSSIHIESLHNDFLVSVLEYCKEQPELSAGYNQDLPDCRRVISVSCLPNKKGIAAKRALVDKFFNVNSVSKKEIEERRIDGVPQLKNRLGIGILAGLDDFEKHITEDQIIKIHLKDVKYHPKNHLYFKDLDKAMKDKLMEDMRDYGQINPIIVKGNDDETYTILAGHQRVIAARRLNWDKIKAIVTDISDDDAEKLLIRDNLFRRHMGGMELARALDAYSRLSDNQINPKSVRQIAEELGENRNTVHFYLKLNKLIPELQQLVDEGKLLPTAAQAFTSMQESDQRKVFETLGEKIIVLKKKEIEDEIKLQYAAEIQESVEVKKQFGELQVELQNLQLSNSSLTRDVNIYKSQVQSKENSLNQMRKQLKEKEIIAEISEEKQKILSSFDVVDSIISELSYGSYTDFNLDELRLFKERLSKVEETIKELIVEIDEGIGEVMAGGEDNLSDNQTEMLG